MSITTDVFDEHEDVVVSIEKNKYTISNDAFQIVRPDDSTLSVIVKHRKEKVLDIRFLNDQIIRVYGHFRYPDAHDVIADENGVENEPVTLSNGCADNAGKALFGFH